MKQPHRQLVARVLAPRGHEPTEWRPPTALTFLSMRIPDLGATDWPVPAPEEGEFREPHGWQGCVEGLALLGLATPTLPG